MVYGKQSMRTRGNLVKCRAGGLVCLTGRITAAAVIVLLAGSSAFGDFLVQPITLRKQVYPGRQIPLEFKVENLSRDTTEEVSLRLGELTQDANGVWNEIDPNNPRGIDLTKLRSCKNWLECDVESVVVDPFQVVPITMMATIPAGTRGFYFAVLIASTAPRQVEIDGTGALIALRYLVPIVLEVQGVPLQHQVELTDLDMVYHPATLNRPTAAVVASMSIKNKGGTYSRLAGVVRVFQESGGNWRRIADLKLPATGIIPNVSLSLKRDVGTLLPSGKYRMEGYLYVDGRRGGAAQKEIDFQGNDRVVDPRTIAPIHVDKEDLLIDVVPGAGRGGTVMVTNESEDPVTVTVEFVLPPHMRNLMSGRGVRGDDLSCVDWVIVRPEEFTLPRYGRRSVNLNVRMPTTIAECPNYYGTLRLHATHDDGSSAGMKVVNVCLTNTKAARTNEVGGEWLSLSEATPGRYVVSARFFNGGVTYVYGRCRGLVTGSGDNIYRQFLMEDTGEGGILLPFEKRTFSGVLDVSDIPVGFYRLTAVLEYANGPKQAAAENAQKQSLIEVYEQGGQKAARNAEWSQAPDGKKGTTVIKLKM